MDKTALDLCGVLLSEYGCRKPIGHDGAHESRTFIDDLGANGYVVVPRHLLVALLSAALDVIVASRNNPSLERLAGAHHDVEAVVEAVGPTREDQR